MAGRKNLQWPGYLEDTFSSSLACLSTFRMISVRGAIVIELRRSMEVFRTESFSLNVQSSCKAFSIAMVASGDVSLYKKKDQVLW